ncbi:hypothetical protein PX554_20185 [Sphingomonas sp. H39-1-10]|uniref:hypothetical protein n=1 Tax=Sphingomonas pollutisoli TaxID=3030829 RepID=UPI0023B9850A|nr:hypothetical protein [Sphingomonas pollutisoli]MDF0490453.1 hypothetical protein [Sphingomonas pollutisoli]
MNRSGDGRIAAPDFRVSLDPDLPPIPGMSSAVPSLPPLASRLWSLLAASGAHIVLPPAETPDPSLVDEFHAIMTAARSFRLGPDMDLAEALWTRAGAFWAGEVATKLREITRIHGRAAAQGFLLLYAGDVDDRIVFSGHASPFAVTDRIDRSDFAIGPWLVLIACRLDPIGQAEPVRGYAQPILSGRRFVPVGSTLERDALTALIELQAKLDAYGLDATIERSFPAESAACDVLLSIRNRDGHTQELRIAIAAAERAIGKTAPEDSDGFVLTPRNWQDGSFVAWLAQTILERPA